MRVLDLSRLLPGPYCSWILAELGMEVIKVERPGGGDWARHAHPLDTTSGESYLFGALNRGKKSVTLDLKTELGRQIMLQLCYSADVLLESFRPGVLERLGLGYETVAVTCPRLVYCSLSGYGSQSVYRQRAGHDLNYQGLAGLVDLTGPRQGPLSVPGVPVADVAGALWAAIGILHALLQRDVSGCGQHVEASLLGGALSLLPLAVAGHRGGQPLQRGSSPLTGGVVCYHVYDTQDGHYMSLAALEPEFWVAFCTAVDRQDLLGDQFAPAVDGEPAYDELCHLFRGRSREEWIRLLASVDACCEPVYSVSEALASAPVHGLGIVDRSGLLPPFQLSAQPREVPRAAPALGQHTRELLGELGYSAEDLERLAAQKII
jgi:alpha-methylacyl-CoA racemase